MASKVYFASAETRTPEARSTLPMKLKRMLGKLNVKEIVKDKVVALKMHVGGSVGYKTIHPLFVRTVVDEIKAGGGRSFVTDCACDTPARGVVRGLTHEVLGAPLVPATGVDDKNYYAHKVRGGKLREVQVAGNIEDADVLINLSHAKGHGNCGFGGAVKNLAMGCVTGRTRGAIHSLEGGLKWHSNKCKRCGLCIKNCPTKSLRFHDDGNLRFNFHLCTYCRHCAYVCPHEAIEVVDADFYNFQKGMAVATEEVLKTFEKSNVLHINFLLGITMFCDCMGFSTLDIVPDIGILASDDAIAVDKASLDMIKEEDFNPKSLYKGRKLLEGEGHLFERIHGKNPFVVLDLLEKRKTGTQKYVLKEIR